MSRKEFNYSAGMRTATGRYHGAGIAGFDPWGDDPDTESGPSRAAEYGCRLPHDKAINQREEWEKLNGPVVIVKEGKQ